MALTLPDYEPYGLVRPAETLSEYDTALLQLAVTLVHPFNTDKVMLNYAAQLSARWVIALLKQNPTLEELYDAIELKQQQHRQHMASFAPTDAATRKANTAALLADLGLG